MDMSPKDTRYIQYAILLLFISSLSSSMSGTYVVQDSGDLLQVLVTPGILIHPSMIFPGHHPWMLQPPASNLAPVPLLPSGYQAGCKSVRAGPLP